MSRRVLLGAVLGALFAIGWWAGGGHAARGLYSGLDLFVEVLQTVEANYVDPVDSGKLVTGAMRGVTHALDPWSRYLDAEEFRALRGRIHGAVDGIGVTVDSRGGWPVVIAPIEGSPAWDAGLEAGDVITEVDGHSTFGLTPDDLAAKLRGAAGTLVKVRLVRGESDREVTLQRRRVTLRNVPYAFVVEPGIGYVRLAQFSDHAGTDVGAACDSLRGLGVRSLVLDLRGNAGGTLEEAVAVAGRFLPGGTRVVSTEGRAAGADHAYDTSRPGPEQDWPLAVLVDGGTASAAEIVAGALQDHDRAVLVGDTTYGKGVSQQVYPLRTGQGALQLTVSRYLTPSGRSIHRAPLGGASGDDDDEDAGAPPADERSPASGREYHTGAGRIVRAGAGLAPDVRVAADTTLARPEAEARRAGGLAAAARAALARDPVERRALQVLRAARDARGVFAAAGIPLPAAGASRR